MDSIFPFFSRDSEVTLGSFAVHFGPRFGTKLGGVLLFRKRLPGSHFGQHFSIFSRDSEVTLGSGDPRRQPRSVPQGLAVLLWRADNAPERGKPEREIQKISLLVSGVGGRGRQPLNPARGPQAPLGRVTAVGPPPPKEVKGTGPRPAADPKNRCVLQHFVALARFRFVGSRWLKMAQHEPQKAPKVANFLTNFDFSTPTKCCKLQHFCALTSLAGAMQRSRKCCKY